MNRGFVLIEFDCECGATSSLQCKRTHGLSTGFHTAVCKQCGKQHPLPAPLLRFDVVGSKRPVFGNVGSHICNRDFRMTLTAGADDD